MTTWGIVATVKADPDVVLEFVAHHLELGADEVNIYLDAPNAAAGLLAAHPKVNVTQCDARYWKMRRPKETHQRPPMHQGRQFANAKWAYMHSAVDWLAHIDVDEFLWPKGDMRDQLAQLPKDSLCARVRPIEALAGDGEATHFKACAENWMQRLDETPKIYPEFGAYLNGGFLSHVAGKLFVRTGLQNIKFKIHNLETPDGNNPGEVLLTDTDLLHMHAKSWDDWLATYQYRKTKGSYRAELAPPVQPPGVHERDPDAPNLHRLFSVLEEAGGEAGLRQFFDEVCAATPELLQRLQRFGHLRRYKTDFTAARQRLFPTEFVAKK